ELVLSVAFLQRRHDPKGFAKTIDLFPETRNFIGLLALNELSAKFEENKLSLENLENIDTFQVELAVYAAWVGEPEKNKELFQQLLKAKKFHTPLVTYVAAASLAQSSSLDAINLLLEASKLQNQEESKWLPVSAVEVAEKGAWFAYDLFETDKSYCEITEQAFENYFIIAADISDQQLEYFYAVILRDCGKPEKSKELLEKLADKAQGKWQKRAVMELAVDSIRQNNNLTIEQKQSLLNKISAIINIDNEKEYCDYAYDIFKLLQELTDRIEEVQINVSDFPKLLDQLVVCSGFCYECFDGTEKYAAALLWGELLVLENSLQRPEFSDLRHFIQATGNENEVPEAELLRFQARILMAEGNFLEAAELWVKICNIREAENLTENERNWQWWRAKYYELYCCRQVPEFKNIELLHTIEILETTYTQIPHLWAEKLNSLKK
ncbi:MAG: hypothetical protein ACYTE8_06015, partial [Planctomycetota bacterium]